MAWKPATQGLDPQERLFRIIWARVLTAANRAVADVIRPPDVDQGVASSLTCQCLLPLMHGQLGLPAEPDAPGLGPLPAFPLRKFCVKYLGPYPRLLRMAFFANKAA